MLFWRSRLLSTVRHAWSRSGVPEGADLRKAEKPPWCTTQSPRSGCPPAPRLRRVPRSVPRRRKAGPDVHAAMALTRGSMGVWQRWVRQPQRVWLRRALFQVHLWTGLALGLYVVVLSITGSALVYRNEMDRYFATPKPTFDPKATRL